VLFAGLVSHAVCSLQKPQVCRLTAIPAIDAVKPGGPEGRGQAGDGGSAAAALCGGHAPLRRSGLCWCAVTVAYLQIHVRTLRVKIPCLKLRHLGCAICGYAAFCSPGLTLAPHHVRYANQASCARAYIATHRPAHLGTVINAKPAPEQARLCVCKGLMATGVTSCCPPPGW